MLLLLSALLLQDQSGGRSAETGEPIPYSPPAVESLDASEPVLLRQTFADGDLWQHTVTFAYHPADARRLADGTKESIASYELKASVAVDAVGSDGTATCTWRSERIIGGLSLADEILPSLDYNSNLTATLRSELEVQVFQPWIDLNEATFRFEASPNGTIALRRRATPTDADDPDAESLTMAIVNLLSWSLPSEPVAIGDNWTRQRRGRTYRSQLTSIDAEGRYVITMSLGGDATGVLRFDPKLRRLVAGQIEQTLPDGSQTRTSWSVEKSDEIDFGF